MEEQRIGRWADLRYEGQAFEVQAAAPPGRSTRPGGFVDQVLGALPRRARTALRVLLPRPPDTVVEWVNLRVAAFGPIDQPRSDEIPAGGGAVAERSRPVFFDDWIDTPIYDRDTLGAGDTISGPADRRGVRLDDPASSPTSRSWWTHSATSCDSQTGAQ